jgi:transmembrane sensor
MKNIFDFYNHRQIKAESAEWLILLDREERPTVDELQQLKNWLGHSPVHRRILKSSAVLWGRLDGLIECVDDISFEEAPQCSDVPISEQRSSWRVFGKAIAASLIVFVIAFAGFYTGESDIDASNGFYSSAVGDRLAESLADGSTIVLNTDSRVEVVFGEQYRDVYLLRGEVYFEVASNPDIPFRVFAGSGRVNAVGTAFTVYLRGNNVDVAVTEGRVSLATLAGTLALGANDLQEVFSLEDSAEDLGMLYAGQIATIAFSANSQVPEKGHIDAIQEIDADKMANHLSWKRGVLIFSGESLEQVADQITRYTAVQIEFSDSSLKQMRVGGAFPVGEATMMLEALETTFGLQVTWVNRNHALVSGGG